MRKPRDFDAELKALNDKAKLLKDRKLIQLGELVIATGTDTLPVDILAGALLAVADNKDGAARESWRKRGEAFFRRTARSDTGGNAQASSRSAPIDGGAASSGAKDSAP